MKVGVIADDLTGANATGVRLSKQGFLTQTKVHYEQEIFESDYNAVCIDTDSRYTDKVTTETRVKKVLENLSQWQADIICKRIDSTVRGNIGIEIDSMLNFLGEKAISIVVASFPDSNRITAGGYLLVNGVPVQETDVAKDPVNPLKNSFIPDIIAGQSEHDVAHIGLDIVLAGRRAILKTLEAAISDQKRIIVFDAVTNEEIENIAQAMVNIEDYKLIPTDPGPLTATYSSLFTKQSSQDKRVIATIGSVTSNTEKQLQYLISKINVEPIYVDALHLVENVENWEAEVNKIVEKALEKIENDELIIITSMPPGKEQLDLGQIAKHQKQNEEYLAKRITDGLAKITRQIVEQSPIKINGIFSCGGDVTASICSVTEAKGIELIDEVQPLLAYGKFVEGHFNGIPLVTKGGMAGDQKAIYTSIKQLLHSN